MSDKPPFEHFYDLNDLRRAGAEVSISLSESERARLARWANVDAVDSFAAQISLGKHSPTRYAFAANLEASIAQSCVVTLEPVRSRIKRQITRELLLASPVKRALPKEALPPTPSVDDELTEEIDSLTYDLAAPLLEEFSLAIDPYPRAPGVAFEPPEDSQEKVEGPFAALKALKGQV
jgi:uncharacterized metal-binding protein YceD (DUF177 family)